MLLELEVTGRFTTLARLGNAAAIHQGMLSSSFSTLWDLTVCVHFGKILLVASGILPSSSVVHLD